MSEVEKLKDLYCKWCPIGEDECSQFTLEEKRGCLACEGFVDELLEAGYRRVEPVQLEVLGDEEIYRIAGGQNADLLLCQAVSQATIAHNSKGQLYRRVENGNT